MDLTTTYLGLKLRTPLVCAASPLSQEIDQIKQMEDAGASAVVLHSLFEEQLRREEMQLEEDLERGVYSSPEALSYFPKTEDFILGPDKYLEHISRAKMAVNIPIIGSLNACSAGGWIRYAEAMQEAGADALELNIYSVPTDPNQTSLDIERSHVEIVRKVTAEVKIPVAVKVSPFYTNFAHMARLLDHSGAKGLVLFNRFYQPDIDLETLEVRPNILFSAPMAMRLPLRWIAILFGHIDANMAATSGIHQATDVLKLLMAGADATMLCSALIQRGIKHISVIERDMTAWLEKHEYESVTQLKGSMSQLRCGDPAAFERAQYLKAITARPMAAS